MSSLPSHLSEGVERYTPRHVVAAVRATMGGIDVDPFSCAEANRGVGATVYYGPDNVDPKLRNGWPRRWYGRAFVNPPGGRGDKGRSQQKRAWFRLATEYAEGRVKQAIFVCFNLGLLQSTQCRTPAGLAIPLDFPICYPSSRLEYTYPGGSVGQQPPHASCVVYLPARGNESTYFGALSRFSAHFSPIGRVVVPA